MNDGNNNEQASSIDFPVVGVGASAGGLEALSEFFSKIPNSTRCAFVVIQHLSPDYKSLMSELLARDTKLPVLEVTKVTKLEAGHIYCLSPSTNLIVENDHLVPLEREKENKLNLPVDLFLSSLARTFKEKSVGMILSGTGSDGVRGIRQIKEVGGLTMAQDPEESAFDGMPRSSIRAGIVDLVLPVEGLAGYFDDITEDEESFFGSVAASDPQRVEEILRVLHSKLNYDFSDYKRPTLQRRIERRMQVCRCKSMQAYLAYLYQNQDEAAILSKDFLIGVTAFFRDESSWVELNEKVIIPMLENHRDNPDEMVKERELRVWSVGCSSGEEVYTLCMLFREAQHKLNYYPSIKIFATDLDEDAIEFASRGRYPRSLVSDVSIDLVTKYFEQEGEYFAVKSALREMAIFSRHNVLIDAPFNNLDLIVCRNVQIYFNTKAQAHCMSIFRFALKQNAALWVGPSESVDRALGFRPINEKHRLFENTSRTKVLASSHLSRSRSGSSNQHSVSRAAATSGMILNDVVNEMLQSQLDFVTVVLDAESNIVSVDGNIKRYLNLPETGFSSNLQRLLPTGLSVTVHNLLRSVKTHDEQFSVSGVQFVKDGVEHTVNVVIRPAKSSYVADGYILMIFPLITRELTNTTSADGNEQVQASQIEALQIELDTTKSNLQASVEELETTNEELQATNEELLAANEELQSTNEELQSLNEELHTVNAELQEKISLLAEANTDIDSLLKTAEFGTIFLDDQMRIRKFTPRVAEQFMLLDRDIGRPITHFKSHFKEDDEKRLFNAIQNVLLYKKNESFVLATKDHHHFQFNVNLVTQGGRSGKEVSGVVISFIEVSEQLKLQRDYEVTTEMFKQIMETTLSGYWDWNIPEHTEYMSPNFKAMFGYAEDEMENTPDSWQEIIHPDDLPGVFEVFKEHVESRGKIPYHNVVRYYHKNGSIVWVICTGKVIEWTESGEPVRMVGCHVDITALKEKELSIDVAADTKN